MSLVDSPAVQSAGPRPLVTEPGSENEAGLDIVQVLWRWKWLPILGAIIGAGTGYLYFSKLPPLYQASALVQVASTLPTAPSRQFYDTSETLGSVTRADESLVIKSQKVLTLAVDRGRLTEQPFFASMQTDQIVAELMVSRNLVIEPADKDANTTLIQISYVCGDAEVAALVVNAIVEGYSEYLSEEYRSIGNELYDVVTEAQSKLATEYKMLTEEALKFQQNNPDVIWTPTGASDPYAENFDLVSKELFRIKVARQKLAGTLQHVDAAVKAGRPAESILLMLATDADSNYVDQQYGGAPRSALNPQLLEPESTPYDLLLDTESKRLERSILFDLKLREKELMNQVADGHPSLASLRLRISEVESKIADLKIAEKELFEDEERRREEALENQVAPEGVTVGERLETRRQALAEEFASLQLQETELQKLADQNQSKSNELRIILNSSKLLDSRLSSIQTMLDAYTEKLSAIELLPQTGQRTLKELNLPSIGVFYGPKFPPYLLGGAAIGFILLSGLAVLMDLADRSYRNPEEIANDLGVAVLGHIPVMDISKVKKSVANVDPSVTSIHHSKGRVSEAYRSVRTGLYFSQHGQNLKVIQVTSPVPGDGKSTLSSNLAVSMAQSGRRVLLIDADFRRPRIAKIFGVDSNVGMATVIAGNAEVDEAIHEGPVANLSIMPGGKRPSNPAELLSSQRFSDLVDVLREKFDVIVIDTPPLLAVSDPGAVAGIVDGVVLTMRLRRNVKPLALRAASILEGVGARCLGVVVNGVSSEAGYGYNYDYNDYRYAYKYGSNYRSGYGYRYGYGNYRYGYSSYDDENLSSSTGEQFDNSNA